MTDRRYGGLLRDEREALRRERLLESGLDTFSDLGWASSTVQDICRAAGLSPRYFYELFDSREDLFLAVTQRIADEVEATVLAAASKADDPLTTAVAVLSAIEDYFTDDPRTIRVALMESLATEQFRQQRRELLLAFSSLGARLMRPLREEPAVGRSARRRLQMSALVLTGGVVEALIAWEAEPDRRSAAPMVGHLTALYSAAAQL